MLHQEGSRIRTYRVSCAQARTLSNPLWAAFTSSTADESVAPRAATNAYNAAVEGLRTTLSPEELRRLQSASTVNAVQVVVTEAQRLWSNRRTNSRLERLVRVLGHYSQGMDILSVAHAEYTGLMWGAMRFILQVRQPLCAPAPIRILLSDINAGVHELFQPAR